MSDLASCGCHYLPMGHRFEDDEETASVCLCRRCRVEWADHQREPCECEGTLQPRPPRSRRRINTAAVLGRARTGEDYSAIAKDENTSRQYISKICRAHGIYRGTHNVRGSDGRFA